MLHFVGPYVFGLPHFAARTAFAARHYVAVVPPIDVAMQLSAGLFGHPGERFDRIGHSAGAEAELFVDWSHCAGVGAAVDIAFVVLSVVGLSLDGQGQDVAGLFPC